MSFGSEVMVRRFNRRKERANTMVAFRPEISAIHSAVWIGRRLVVDGPTLGNRLYDTAYMPICRAMHGLCVAFA